jgi:phospholipid/cholesterol/gamma-HCH transport system substrate-binding protein
VLDTLEPGLKVLADQRTQLVTLLQALDELSGVAVDTVDKSKADLVADLKALTPTLQKLAEAGTNLPNALQLLFTYPFPDAAVDGIKGDYTNLYADIDLNLGTIVDNLGSSRQGLLPGVPGLDGKPLPSLPLPSLPLPLPNLPVPGIGTGTGLGDLLGGLLGGGRP